MPFLVLSRKQGFWGDNEFIGVLKKYIFQWVDHLKSILFCGLFDVFGLLIVSFNYFIMKPKKKLQNCVYNAIC